MIVARTKRIWSFSPWLTVLLGVALFIVGGLNINYVEVKENPIIWLLSVCFLVFILFILPLRNIGTYQEYIIDGHNLIFRKQPARKEICFDLGSMKGWSINGSSGRYDYGRNLQVNFSDFSKVVISEMEYSNFNELIVYFEKRYANIKSTK